jgi:hypothetical protein
MLDGFDPILTHYREDSAGLGDAGASERNRDHEAG